MGKNELEIQRLVIEKKKLEIEKAKVLEGILRIVIIAILTLGAGAGTIIFRLYNTQLVNKIILTLILSLIISLSIFAVFLWMDIRKALKRN
ncbi:hypothetical protein [Persephonella sp.]